AARGEVAHDQVAPLVLGIRVRLPLVDGQEPRVVREPEALRVHFRVLRTRTQLQQLERARDRLALAPQLPLLRLRRADQVRDPAAVRRERGRGAVLRGVDALAVQLAYEG